MGFELGRREFLGGVAMAGLLGGCRVSEAGNEAGATAGSDLAKSLEGIADQLLAEYPQNATILGIAKGNREPLAHQWQDQTPAGVAARKAAIGKRLDTLRGLDIADLGNLDKLNGAVALQAHELAAAGYAFPFGDPRPLSEAPQHELPRTPHRRQRLAVGREREAHHACVGLFTETRDEFPRREIEHGHCPVRAARGDERFIRRDRNRIHAVLRT